MRVTDNELIEKHKLYETFRNTLVEKVLSVVSLVGFIRRDPLLLPRSSVATGSVSLRAPNLSPSH